jgi:hypothetical protein
LPPLAKALMGSSKKEFISHAMIEGHGRVVEILLGSVDTLFELVVIVKILARVESVVPLLKGGISIVIGGHVELVD